VKIVLDPGHGGKDPGACGKTLKEKDVTLAVAQIRRPKLEALGHEVLLSRYSDCDVPLSSRTCRANEWGADVLLSIHCNGAENPQAHGFEVWTSPGTTRADNLATIILDTWHRRFPSVRLRQDFADGDGDKEGRFWVLMKSKMPAVLVELGFITNPAWEALAGERKMLDVWAEALKESLCLWDCNGRK
jgi:N-acetylmuramoyl-L-alanine amidase